MCIPARDMHASLVEFNDVFAIGATSPFLLFSEGMEEQILTNARIKVRVRVRVRVVVGEVSLEVKAREVGMPGHHASQAKETVTIWALHIHNTIFLLLLLLLHFLLLLA